MFNLKSILLIPFCFMFLPAFSFFIGTTNIKVHYVLTIILFFLYVLLCFKTFYKDLVMLIRHTAFKYLMYFVLWCFFSGLFLLIFGKYPLPRYFYYFIFYLLVTMIIPLLYVSLIICKYFKTIFIIKCLLLIYFFVGLVGIIDAIGRFFSVNVLLNMISFISNARYLTGLHTISLYANRIHGLFEEPGWLAGFIVINLPVIYGLCNSKFRIFDNLIINKFIKKVLPFLMWINIFLTQSPIWLVFALILTLFYYYKKIISFIAKHALFIISTCMALIISIMIVSRQIDVSETYINRIIIVIQTLMDVDKFVLLEPSLASRVCSYVNSFRLFLDYPITGIGLGNSKYYIADYFLTSPIPLTIENITKLNLSYLTGKVTAFNSSLLWEYLSELGLIGCLIFYSFLYKLIKQLKHISLRYKNIIYIFIQSIAQSIMAIALVSFYDISSLFIHIWIIFGIGVGLIFKSCKCQIRKEKHEYTRANN